MNLRSVVGVYLILLTIAVVIAGCATKGLDYESGMREFDAGRYNEALKVFESIANEGGKYANRARFYMGECYKYQFKWDKAMENFQMVADAEGKSFLGSEAKNRIAQIREGRRDVERLDIIYKNNPGTEQAADALLELGSVYDNKLYDFDNAIKTYRRVVEEFPGSAKAAQAQINIGYVYLYKTYDYEKAWEEFKKVNEQNYPDLKFRIAEVKDLLLNTNKILQEIRDQQAFIKESQKRQLVEGRHISGYELYGAKQDQVAQSFIAIGKKWRQLKNYPRALEAYEMLIDRLPLQLRFAAEARFGIAEIYQVDLGRYLDAIDAYEAYIKYHPTDYRRDEAVYNMAICYEALRDYDRAYEYYKTYRDTYRDGKFFKTAELKVRQYEYDEDQDGHPYYKELAAGTSDTNPDQHP